MWVPQTSVILEDQDLTVTFVISSVIFIAGLCF